MSSDMTEVTADLRDTRCVQVLGSLVVGTFLRIGGVVEK
jgi:hypothetical protein